MSAYNTYRLGAVEPAVMIRELLMQEDRLPARIILVSETEVIVNTPREAELFCAGVCFGRGHELNLFSR